MSHTDPRPNFGEDSDTAFESLMEGVFTQNAGLDEEFRSLDTKIAIEKRTAEHEAVVIDYLESVIPDVAALKKMLVSLAEAGVTHPTIDNVTTIIEEMAQDDDYDDYPDEFFGEIMRMEKFAVIIEQLARSESRPVILSKDDVLTEIVTEELFTPEERTALVDAADLFLASE